jgi:EAL domain-containing protein (putative c-di-GMP-specific phosphodiesterase class I)
MAGARVDEELAGGAFADAGRVLVVDDDPDILIFVREVLTHSGFEVHTAGSGGHAVERVAQGAFDAVVSDIRMPGMDGLELLRTVRRHRPDLPVILMTATPDVGTAMEACEFGALRYLLKPLSPPAVAAAVKEGVRLHRMALLSRAALANVKAAQQEADRSLGHSFERALASAYMAFQPIMYASSRRVFGYEALVRNDDPTLAEPGRLFGAAVQLDRLSVLSRTIRARIAGNWPWQDAPSTLFVNVHPLDLGDPALYAPDQPLSTHASSVVLELTERAPLEATPELRAQIKDLRSMGYRLAVDDLGAGYAGLNSFVILEPDVVKLDQTLVRGLDAEPVRRSLIRSMIGLCEELRITVVAEGVETQAELDVLVDLGCDLVQGYLLGRPAPVPSFRDLTRR